MRSIASWHLLECENTSFLHSVSTQLLLRKGVNVLDHVLHLSEVSPQLQVLALGFSWALISVRKWWKVASGLLAFLRTPCSWIVIGHLR